MRETARVTRLLHQPLWIVWHPHQKLWNWRLVEALSRVPGGRFVASGILTIDTLLLWVRVVSRRARRIGARTVVVDKRALPTEALYIDCGVHREGVQIQSMTNWFSPLLRLWTIGFEASPESYPVARSSLTAVPNLDLRQQALVGPAFGSDLVRLYRAGGDGKGDSLFAERGDAYDDVPAVRLSSVMQRFLDDHGPMPIILRMNIEGAELFVVEDLIAAGMTKMIAGYYGMWDDLSKIDVRRDREFRRLLRMHSIATLTFNDRDSEVPLRLSAIRYDIVTSLIAGTRAHVTGK